MLREIDDKVQNPLSIVKSLIGLRYISMILMGIKRLFQKLLGGI